MPGYQKDDRRDFSKFDSMSSGELEEILRLDAMKSDDEESDIDMLLYVMEVLAERRKNSADPGKTAEEAYQSFLENYYIENTEVTDENTHNAIPFRPKRDRAGWKRPLTAAAACVAILLCGTAVSAVLAEDGLAPLFDWTKDVFSFSTPDETCTSDEYELVDDSWENVLRKRNIPEDLMPLQPLEGFEQSKVIVTETPEMRSVSGYFDDGDREIRMTLKVLLSDDSYQMEKTEGLVEIFELNGIQYNIFSNKNQMQVIWQVDIYECIIAGDLSVDEIKLLVHSIQEG